MSTISISYRVIHLVVHLGWVDFDFVRSTVWPDLLRILAEFARQVGNMAEYPNPSQPNHGLSLRPYGTPCTVVFVSFQVLSMRLSQ